VFSVKSRASIIPTIGAPTGNRSRARAFSFLDQSPALFSVSRNDEERSEYPPSPHTRVQSSAASMADNPFATADYRDALALSFRQSFDSDSDDSLDSRDASVDGDDATRINATRESGRERRASRREERRAYRDTFQPLIAIEITWMTVSATAVLMLTILAMVIAFRR